MTRVQKTEGGDPSNFLLGWLYCTFDISARFMIFSAAARLSSSVQPEAIIRTQNQVSRNLPETPTGLLTQTRKSSKLVATSTVPKGVDPDGSESRY